MQQRTREPRFREDKVAIMRYYLVNAILDSENYLYADKHLDIGEDGCIKKTSFSKFFTGETVSILLNEENKLYSRELNYMEGNPLINYLKKKGLKSKDIFKEDLPFQFYKFMYFLHTIVLVNQNDRIHKTIRQIGGSLVLKKYLLDLLDMSFEDFEDYFYENIDLCQNLDRQSGRVTEGMVTLSSDGSLTTLETDSQDLIEKTLEHPEN